MGSGVSKNKKLECPEDGDPKRFAELMKQYDAMDKDGDMAIVGKECQALADNNVVGRISATKRSIDQVKQELGHILLLINAEKAKAEIDLENRFCEKIEKVKKDTNEKIGDFQHHLDILLDMTPDERIKLLHHTISNNDGDGITFWEYYDFMLDRPLYPPKVKLATCSPVSPSPITTSESDY